MTSSSTAEFFLAIRSEIRIAAPPASVWSFLDRPRDWKPSIVAIEHLHGEPDTEGELLRVAQRPGDQTVQVLMRTVRLEPPSWRVQTLTTENSRATDGFVIYSLQPTDGATQLTCEVVGRCVLPWSALSGSTVEEFARRINQDTRAKLETDLRLLKALAEKPH